jgi:hypothetical protein
VGLGGNGRLGLLKIGNLGFVVMIGDGILADKGVLLSDDGEYSRIREFTLG